MGKLKLYYFSAERLSFVEAKTAKLKTSAIAVLLTVIIAVSLFWFNEEFDDALGLGVMRMSALSRENTLLKKQLGTVTTTLERLHNQLAELNDRNNELRLLVDLPGVDEETRRAGIGGTEERVYFGGAADVDEQLQNIATLLSSAERELQLQHSSYTQVTDKYESNQTRFAHLPAIKPMQGFISSKFGMRLHPILRFNRPHEGTDIVNVSGSPIYAAGDGVVKSVGRSEGGYGIMVIIDHGYGYTTLYGHMSKSHVHSGQRVKRGDLIGACGKTGLATNSHLHYEVRLNGVQQNPIDYFFDDFNYVEAMTSEVEGSRQ
ncbi:MAG: M23 family metallopeptidase [Ignavibacteriae bacterium]|nr:M23 family metallopeptidase [Ignavibacteriota bacterium]